MPRPASPRSYVPLLLTLVVFTALPARATEIRLISADDRGVTLRLEIPPFALEGGAQGRSEVTGTGLPVLDEPGRPRLPYAYALLAVPPGGGVSATVEPGPEEIRDGVRIAIGDRPAWMQDPGGLGITPTREPAPALADGPWPATVELSAPFTVRRQRMVTVQIRPFSYDEATGRLWARRSVTVRVSFTGGRNAGTGLPAGEDRHWEPVLERALLNYQQGRRWRAAPVPGGGTGREFRPGLPGPLGIGSGAAFDETEPEVRVKVDTSGVYGLEYSKLEAKGFPAGVPIGEVSVHRHEFTGLTSPPYDTVELPIEIEEGANRNGVFDAGDRIVLWVQNWAQRSRASGAQRAWGDAEIVYVTRLPGRSGARIALRSGWRNATPPVLPSYPWTQRWERNFTYMNFPPDTNADPFHWTEVVGYYDRPDTFVFETNRLDATRDVTFSVTFQGRRNDGHWTWCDIKNGSGQYSSIVDSSFWSGRDARSFTKTLPGTAFSEGRTNRMRYWGKTFSSAPHPVTNGVAYVALNFFEAVYWRSYRALAGYLACNSGDATGEFEIQAEGFPLDSIRAYDVSDSLNPIRLTDVVSEPATPSGFRLRLQDQVAAAPHAYVVFSLPKLLPASRYSAVTRQQLYAQPPADYLLITPEEFLSAANALADLRRSEGLRVLIATVAAVNDEFNGGRASSYAIRRFLRYGYDNWNASFVLLMGDGSEDPLNFSGSAGRDWIPVQRILGPIVVYTGDGFFSETVSGDPWYTWAIDTPPDRQDQQGNPPYLPDLFLGRLPVNSLQEASDMVDKLIAYEQVDTTQTWRRRILLHADDAFSGPSTFGGNPGTSAYCYKPEEVPFVTLNQAVQSVIADSAGLALCEPELFDVNVLLKDETVINGCRPDQAATQAHARNLVTDPLVDRLNDGRLWWNYQGHANAQVLEHEYVWRNFPFDQDNSRLKNDRKPFLFSAFSCHANQFAATLENSVGRCIAENLLALPRRGAIASWASPGYELIPSSRTEHLNVQLARALFLRPPRDDYLGHGASAVMGEALALTLLLNQTARGRSATEGITYLLLGDPGTRFTVGPPQMIVTANGAPVTSGVPVFLPGLSDTLLLEAEIVSNAAIDSIGLERTDATSTVIVPPSDYTLTPPFPDTGPGSGGGRRFHLAYRTQLTAENFRYTLRSRDRYGAQDHFDVVFAFQTVLMAEGRPIRDDDPVARDANLTVLLLSPTTVNPQTDITLLVDDVPQPFQYAPANNDPSGRQWLLSWTHPLYAAGTHVVKAAVTGSAPGVHRFQVVPQVRISNLMSFPNPFNDEFGTRFTFTLTGDEPADIKLRVFTVTGRMVYERNERSVSPGYHELPWDGRDAEGDRLGNGVYLYRVLAASPSGHASEQGRLVKLRRPHQAEETATQ